MAGKVAAISERRLGARYQFLIVLNSTEEAYSYGGGLILRRRLISTEEGNFYGGGLFLRRRLISTEEANFYGGG